MKAFSLIEIAIHFFSVLKLESLGFFIRTSPPINSCLHHFPRILLGKLKSNGGHPSKFLNLKLLNPSNNDLILKSPSPRSLQKLRYLFGPNLYQAHLLGPKFLPKFIFLQIRPIKPTSKKSKNRQLKPCLDLQIQTKTKKTQPQALPSNKMKTCAMASHTLPLSNGNLGSIFNSLYSR